MTARAIYETATGVIRRIINCPDDEEADANTDNDESWVVCAPGVTDLSHYIDAGVVTARPAQPTETHVWDAGTSAWVQDIAALASSLKTQVTDLFNTKQNANFVYATFTFQGDSESRERINEVLNYIHDGAALPPDWGGWRDVDNENRWTAESYSTLITHLSAMRNILVERRQALFTVATDHKDAIDALALASNVAGLEAYDVTADWP